MHEIIPYKQHGSTCVICCMLMLLEYYEIIPKAIKYNESKLFKKLKSKYMEGTPFSAACWYLSKENLYCELVHSEEHIFKNDGYLNEESFNELMEEYNLWCKYCEEKGAKISNGIDIDISFLTGKISEDYKIILAGKVDDYLHAIVLEKYCDNKFVVCDPLMKDKTILSEEDVMNFMNTPLGKWCICVKERHID